MILSRALVHREEIGKVRWPTLHYLHCSSPFTLAPAIMNQSSEQFQPHLVAESHATRSIAIIAPDSA